MTARWMLVLLVAILCAPCVAIAQADDARASMEREATALFDALRTSGCEFNRNGTWHDGAKAAQHLQRKYEHLRGKVGTTEEFIEQGATASSMSGKAYQVRCGEAAAVPSGEWLLEKLYELRQSGRFDSA